MRHGNMVKVVQGFICNAVIVVLAMTGIQSLGQETPPPQAGNAEVAKIMREFPGRGDLGDGSEPRGPQETVAVLKVPADLQVELVVAEPQITQPIHLSFDSQGRMWVVEYRQYPFPEGLKVVRYDQHLRAVFDRVPDAPPNHVRGADRISVLVDSDGDGDYDAQRVVIDGLNIATSVAIGRGGIWVMNPPYLLFYPDADGDAICDGDPEVHLSGFGLEDTHSVANSLILAPDGWLYGVNGSTTTARVEVPLGDQEAVAYEGQCVWRYHPEQHDFEIFAEGGGNPFGLEFDAEGQLFSGTNWGDTRGMHYVQGAYGVKSWGKHGPLTNPYAFGYFNHMPFKGDGRRFTEEFVIYDDTVLPERYRGHLIAVNPLQRIVFASHKIEATSTFRTEDFESFIETEDRWFRPVDVTVGPDGNLYFADWYDTRLTHVDPRDNWHKSSGRIYRVGSKTPPDKDNTWDDVIPSRTRFDLKQVSSQQLLRVIESHPGRFFRHAAVEVLATRKPTELIPVLRSHLLEPTSQTLEGLWAYVRIVGAAGFGRDQELLTALVRAPNRNLRRWAVRLIGDERVTEQAAMEFLRSLAEQETDPQVRSQLASTAKRIPGAPGASLALRMIQDDLDVDRNDLHTPLLLWWALEGHVASEATVIADTLKTDSPIWQSKLFCETILGRLAKRCAMQGSTESFGLVESLLQQVPGNELRDRLFRGFEEGLAERPGAGLPDTLGKIYAEYRASSPVADVKFKLRQGDESVQNDAVRLIRDTKVLVADRIELIELVGQQRLKNAVGPLLGCLQDPSVAVRRSALQTLARFDDDGIGGQIAAGYQAMDSRSGLRPIAVRVLVSRPAWARRLIAEIDALKIPAEEVSPDMIVQMQAHGDESLNAELQRIWGNVRSTPEEKQVQIAALMKLAKEPGDLARGKELYLEKCGKCHRLFGEGGDVGPDLTGYERSNLDFLGLAIIDPSAAIREEYTNYQVLTVDGQLLTGLLVNRTEQAIELRTAEGQNIRVLQDEIETLKASPISLMPEDQLSGLSEEAIRDLMNYITS